MMYNTINNRPLQIILAGFGSCVRRFHQGGVFFGEERLEQLVHSGIVDYK